MPILILPDRELEVKEASVGNMYVAFRLYVCGV